MFVNFSEETRHLLKQAEKEKEELNHPYVGSEHLFLSILKDSRLIDLLKKHKITYQKFKDKLISLIGVGSNKSEFTLYTPLLKRVLENSVIEAREENNKIVNPEIVIISILDEGDGIAYSILKSFNVNIDKLYYDLKNKKNNKNIRKKKLLLEELGSNLTKLAKEKKLDPVIGRNKEIKKTIEILLRRKKNNPILIGPAGVGKTAIVEGIANLMVSNRCPKFLENKRVISLNIFSLVSGTKYRGEFEEKMKTLIKELEENEDIILFIDEIHTMVGAGGAEGAIDASNIFKPALARGIIRIIGATTFDEYKKYIEPDAALARRFQSVMVEEPDKTSLIKILTEIKPLYEKYHNIKISDKLVKDIVFLTGKYLTNRFEPDRSIDILDEVCARSSVLESRDEKRMRFLDIKLSKIEKEKFKALSNNDFKSACSLKNEENKIIEELNSIKPNEKHVTKFDVLEVIKNKGNLKIPGITDERKRFYNELEKKLNNEVIGQEDIIKSLVRSLKRRDLSKNKKTYSVLITGETGSGKTLLANTFLNNIVNEKDIIKIDLSEYKEYHTISKLIGTTAGYLGYDNKNHIFEKVRTNPSSALIIDNFEKSCQDVKEIFLRILETGEIEDASGKKIDFSNAVIIFTSTKHKNGISVGFNSNKKDSLDFLPEKLVNKVSIKINMKDLSNEEIKKIINKKIFKLIDLYPGIKVEFPDGYVNCVLNHVNKKKDLSVIDTFIESDLESQIIEGLIDYKKLIKIDIKDKSDIAI